MSTLEQRSQNLLWLDRQLLACYPARTVARHVNSAMRSIAHKPCANQLLRTREEGPTQARAYAAHAWEAGAQSAAGSRTL
eukprot:219836-Chlamydomonas_euryale.AAC.4